jgi:hypothetical protein
LCLDQLVLVPHPPHHRQPAHQLIQVLILENNPQQHLQGLSLKR